VIADDCDEVLQEIQSLLDPEFEVVCAVKDGQSLLPAVREWRPDAVVTDLSMPGRSGLDAGRQVVAEGLCESVILLTGFHEPLLVESAIRTGIRGYVLKVDAGDELITAVRFVMEGAVYISKGALTRPG
jgi:DNA-binding NarL/FixJ family response regulator